jgi:acetyl-CoA C-acetyltransferase
MREVYVVGIGQTAISEQWSEGLRQLAFHALREAAQDAAQGAGNLRPEALFVGNMLAARLSAQQHLGPLIADFCGWRGIEAVTVEAACASAGAAFQAGVRAVASGMVEIAAVVGVEKMTDGIGSAITSALVTAADSDYESVMGATFVSLNALAMQRYMHEYQIEREAFAAFAVNAHQNGVHNPHAMFRKAISEETYRQSQMISPPMSIFDSAPICDGAAAAILCSKEVLKNIPEAIPVRVLGSASTTDSVTLAERGSMLEMAAVRSSTEKALAMAGVALKDLDLYEAHDAFSIMAALSLEAAGFAKPGRATQFAAEGEIGIHGSIPISTMGGLKARGHPVGATGMYQIADLVTQLRGLAGPNQVRGARIGMAQNIGGTGATVVTHVLARE